MSNLDDYVSQTEAAEILGVDGSTVHRWIKQGQLEVVKRIGYTKLLRRAKVEQLRAKRLRDEQAEAKSA